VTKRTAFALVSASYLIDIARSFPTWKVCTKPAMVRALSVADLNKSSRRTKDGKRNYNRP
jgi:hypothetical protein